MPTARPLASTTARRRAGLASIWRRAMARKAVSGETATGSMTSRTAKWGAWSIWLARTRDKPRVVTTPKGRPSSRTRASPAPASSRVLAAQAAVVQSPRLSGLAGGSSLTEMRCRLAVADCTAMPILGERTPLRLWPPRCPDAGPDCPADHQPAGSHDNTTGPAGPSGAPVMRQRGYGPQSGFPFAAWVRPGTKKLRAR